MTPREYLSTIVRPNIAEFKASYNDTRLGQNAASALDILMAYIYDWCRKNAPHEVAGIKDDGVFRHQLVARTSSEDLALLLDVAKCQRHVLLQKGNPNVTSADQVRTQSLGWGKARWSEGRWDGPPQVVVETNDGKFRVLETILDHSLDLLEVEMQRLGI